VNDVTIRDLLIGESAAMRQLRARISSVARSRLPVLIQGPTGSGKELVARALHTASNR
jgi:two-component system response regulator PilR (NtrC family)